VDGACQNASFDSTFGCWSNADCPDSHQCIKNFPPSSPCLNQCIPDGTPFNSCCHIHPVSGCADLECQESVCTADDLAYCCETNEEDPFIWDIPCVNAAKLVCTETCGS